jgi:hypothetical protein
MQTVRLSDGTEIHATMPLGERIDTRFVQLTGKVVSPNQIDARTVHNIGETFDTESYNGAVDLILGEISLEYNIGI